MTASYESRESFSKGPVFSALTLALVVIDPSWPLRGQVLRLILSAGGFPRIQGTLQRQQRFVLPNASRIQFLTAWLIVRWSMPNSLLSAQRKCPPSGDIPRPTSGEPAKSTTAGKVIVSGSCANARKCPPRGSVASPPVSPTARRPAAIVERGSGGKHARRNEKVRREPRGFSQIHRMVRGGQQLYSRTMFADGEAALIARTDSMRFQVMIPN